MFGNAEIFLRSQKPMCYPPGPVAPSAADGASLLQTTKSSTTKHSLLSNRPKARSILNEGFLKNFGVSHRAFLEEAHPQNCCSQGEKVYIQRLPPGEESSSGNVLK